MRQHGDFTALSNVELSISSSLKEGTAFCELAQLSLIRTGVLAK